MFAQNEGGVVIVPANMQSQGMRMILDTSDVRR